MARDYQRESDLESPARKRARAQRNAARRAMLRQLTAKHGAAVAERMMKGKDVDHKRSLAKGGSNKPSNWRLRDEHENRADKRGLFTGSKTTRPKNPKADQRKKY